MTPPKQDDLDLRRDELVADLTAKIAGARGADGAEAKRRPLRLSRIRLRTLLLPAFVVFLLVRFSGSAGAPLGVEAAFEPGSGSSFAGVVHVDPTGAPDGQPSDRDPGGVRSIPVEPGDMVGTTAGSPGTLTLGKGSLELHAGARALVESMVPPRLRLIRGTAVAQGAVRVVTVNGILDQAEGETLLVVSPDGLRVVLRSGVASLVTPEGEVSLAPGEERLVR